MKIFRTFGKSFLAGFSEALTAFPAECFRVFNFFPTKVNMFIFNWQIPEEKNAQFDRMSFFL